MHIVGPDSKRPLKAVIPACVAAVLIGVVAIQAIRGSYGSVNGGNSPRETMLWVLFGALAAATLAGAALSATGWRLGQTLLYSAAISCLFLAAPAPVIGFVLIPLGFLAIVAAGKPHLSLAALLAVLLIPWLALAAALALTR
jgi:hypothetical protein